MPTLTINDKEVTVPDGVNILQACELAGVEIPRFCYHERLSVAGNCRMCLVEMVDPRGRPAPKPVASCHMPAQEGIKVFTDSELTRKARRGVMEFLLINHPLDCPICDQGGECDLQDQAMAYGVDFSRFREPKRATEDLDLGPLVETHMTRCISCTRCIRFAAEVAGVEEIGALGRGEDMEITTLERAINSELSGNLVDICPVGALTSRPYAFAARPWELRKTPSVDVMDAVGSNIRVDTRGREVMRVLPRLHEDINEEWIHDKTRHACDGLRRQRLDRPYVRDRDGRLQEADWDEAFEAVAARLRASNGSRVAALAGDLADCESMLALRDLMRALGSPHMDCRQDGARFDTRERAGYLFNTTIAGIERADACLIVGSNPRREAAMINARLRKRFLAGGVRVGLIGEPAELTYQVDYLGAGPETLREVADGRHSFAKVLESAERPMMIVGMGALARPDGAAVQGLARRIAERFGMVGDDWTGFNVLHNAAARVGGLDLGFLPGEGGRDTEGILQAASAGDLDVVYLLGADEVDMDRLGKAFVVYQGHHGDAGAHRADVVLPGAAYTEKNASYVNTEGRVQLGRLAATPPGEAREDWAILRALSGYLDAGPLPYDNLGQVRQHLIRTDPHFAAVDQVPRAPWADFGAESGLDETTAFRGAVDNFYMTDPISRNSETMARCTAAFLRTNDKATGTHG